jgi:hypothetical protein
MSDYNPETHPEPAVAVAAVVVESEKK